MQCYASATYYSIPLLVSISTFTTYILLGNETLSVATALTSLALFDLLRFPLFMLPNVINNVVEAKISIDRLQSFLMESDRLPVNHDIHVDNDNVIIMKNATMVWESASYRKKTELKPKINPNWFRRFMNYFNSQSVTNSNGNNNENDYITIDKTDEEFFLDIVQSYQIENDSFITSLENQILSLQKPELTNSDNLINNIINENDNKSYENTLTLFRMNIAAKRGELLAIIGSVGAGKSSLLSSLLGDIKCYFGSINIIDSNISYVGQRPFIQNATLRDNILFGCKYNELKYQQVIFQCCLEQDLAILPAGDMTEIGERGINVR